MLVFVTFPFLKLLKVEAVNSVKFSDNMIFIYALSGILAVIVSLVEFSSTGRYSLSIDPLMIGTGLWVSLR